MPERRKRSALFWIIPRFDHKPVSAIIADRHLGECLGDREALRPMLFQVEVGNSAATCELNIRHNASPRKPDTA